MSELHVRHRLSSFQSKQERSSRDRHSRSTAAVTQFGEAHRREYSSIETSRSPPLLFFFITRPRSTSYLHIRTHILVHTSSPWLRREVCYEKGMSQEATAPLLPYVPQHLFTPISPSLALDRRKHACYVTLMSHAQGQGDHPSTSNNNAPYRIAG